MKEKMKVFKFKCGEYFYAYSGETEQAAREALIEEHNPKMIGSVDEIPESEWDKKFISMYEDNDHSKEPFKISIREAMNGNTPELVFTNDIID
jgi:hypothetical protein